MKKWIVGLLVGGLLCTPTQEIQKLGVGGPEKASPSSFEELEGIVDTESLDTKKVDELISIGISLEEARSRLAEVKTVEMVRPNIWPVVGLIVSDYGWRIMGRRKEFHTGVDISAPYGSPVSVASDGRVIFAGSVRGYGNTVIVYHGYGFVTLYAHLNKIMVETGDSVVKGQIIGAVGCTGRCTGPHLHYEVIKYGIRQNPIAYLP
ncbi:M23 family metallopeptidase [Thermocrinis minervae]|uniref:Peptidase family M23 n=1 Tax=Thermocrinis minervae TaxID=381751 RepID=A0A1M6QSR1_9AQUI|nr:M23 family metallopeptidase [Thermocrinis minervae]SHK23254.1 Peptidase family M23 [Thermocrinis minervae]